MGASCSGSQLVGRVDFQLLESKGQVFYWFWLSWCLITISAEDFVFTWKSVQDAVADLLR